MVDIELFFRARKTPIFPSKFALTTKGRLRLSLYAESKKEKIPVRR